MRQALSDIRVLDLTRALSGPFCTMVLGDLGADVVKVEPMPGGDMIRQWGPFDHDISVYYLSANRNKKGVAIDFRSDAGLALIRDMARRADVVVENFKAGTMAAMGLDYATLSQDNPRLIMASISGFGSRGPASGWPGFDQIAQGYSGLMSLTGTDASGPLRVGTAIGDLTSGMWLALGVLAAHAQRQRTGLGQHIETSLLASLMGLLSVQGQRYLSLGDVPKPSGNVHPVIAPYGAFETADGLINLAPATQDMWVRLCRITGLEHLVDDARFLTNADRMQHSLALKTLLEQALRTRGKLEWTRVMLAEGIPAGPINTLDNVFADPQVLACELVQTMEHPVLGSLRQVDLPVASSDRTEPVQHQAPPVFGQHTLSVLRQWGFDEPRIQAWVQDNVVFQA